MTKNYLELIISKIQDKNSKHAFKLRKTLDEMEAGHKVKANIFYKKYDNYLEIENKTLDFGVDCYLHMMKDMIRQRLQFIKAGTYSNSSFNDVEKRVYSNPEIMTYHMHGLVLAQFLWIDQCQRFSFFSDNLLKYADACNCYLEIGGGHGLYIMEALDLLPATAHFDLVDISQSSIDLAKGILDNDKVNYIFRNIFDFNENENKYDFITIGEVLEHLEDPLLLLKKIVDLLSDKGVCYITTPVNAPMIDHIYLFNSVGEIRALFYSAGLEILEEKIAISDNESEEYAKKNRSPIM